MGTNTTRIPSHQLSNGLYVSGFPEQYKERQPSFTTTAMPYTGGDIKKSGELGKMFDIAVIEPPPKSRKSTPQTYHQKREQYGTHSGPLSSNGLPRQSSTQNRSGPLAPHHNRSGPLVMSSHHDHSSGLMTSSAHNRSGPLTSAQSRSGPLASSTHHEHQSGNRSGSNSQRNSGPLSRQNSGTLIPATGLIVSGPTITSDPLSSSSVKKTHFSGPLDASGMPMKASHTALNNISHQGKAIKTSLPMVILWVVVPLFIMGFIAGGFILVTVHNAILLVVIGGLFLCVMLLLAWNLLWPSNSDAKILDSYEDADLSNAKDGDYVKVTGVVTCGSLPLESSYQRMNRCIYTSTGLYEYRAFHSKPARPGHQRFTWALRYLERHVVDFYISDFQSGLRALVKAGYGAPVMPLVHESLVVEVCAGNKEPLPHDFVRWMGHKNLSCDDRLMHLKEGYIKEGSTVTVFGVVQRHENVLMIVPPRTSISTGCLWSKLGFPKTVDGLIISCEQELKNDGIPL